MSPYIFNYKRSAPRDWVISLQIHSLRCEKLMDNVDVPGVKRNVIKNMSDNISK